MNVFLYEVHIKCTSYFYNIPDLFISLRDCWCIPFYNFCGFASFISSWSNFHLFFSTVKGLFIPLFIFRQSKPGLDWLSVTNFGRDRTETSLVFPRWIFCMIGCTMCAIVSMSHCFWVFSLALLAMVCTQYNISCLQSWHYIGVTKNHSKILSCSFYFIIGIVTSVKKIDKILLQFKWFFFKILQCVFMFSLWNFFVFILL